MAVVLVESFGWCGTPAILALRYNSSAGGASIGANGRFSAGPALRINSGSQQNYQLPGGAIGPDVSTGFACRAVNWAGFGVLFRFFDGGFGAAQTQLYIEVQANSICRLVRGDGVVLCTGTRILQNNSYYYFEVSYNIDDVTGKCALYLDGVLECSATNVDTRRLTATVNGAAMIGSGAAATDYCDWYFQNSYAILGERRCLNLTPTSDGTYSEWTPSTGTSHFAMVDEIPPNGDTDYLSSVTVGQRDIFGFSDLPYTPATVDAVQVSLYARKDDAAVRQIAPLLRTAGADQLGTAVTLTTSYLDYLQVYVVNPTTAAAWTPAQVNALEAGVQMIA